MLLFSDHKFDYWHGTSGSVHWPLMPHFLPLFLFRHFMYVQSMSLQTLIKSKLSYAIPIFEVKRLGSLCPSFSGNLFYVEVCHCFPHRFTSLSPNRLSYSFMTCWVGMGAHWYWKISYHKDDWTGLMQRGVLGWWSDTQLL